MSATALQRVVVRMLFDAAFCQAVYRNPTQVLQDLDLTAQERQWLVTPDQRAYRADTYRSSRALTGLLEEYPVAGAVALRCKQGFKRLQDFFASPYLHRCIQERGSLAQAFGEYLGAAVFQEQEEVARLATLELAIAQVRRAVEPTAFPGDRLTDATKICLAPWVALCTTHPTTLRRYSTLLTRLQRHRASLVEAVLDLKLRLPASPPFAKAPNVWVLVVKIPGEAGPSLESASEELGTLLAAARQTIALKDFAKIAIDLGAELHEATEMIQGFIAEQLLIQVF